MPDPIVLLILGSSLHQKKHKLLNPWLIGSGSVALLGMITLLFLGSSIASNSAKTSVAIFLLFLIPTAVLIAGATWIKIFFPYSDATACNSCEYDLRAHQEYLEICPECGKDPTVTSDRISWKRAIRQLPGCLLILISIVGFLFASLMWFLSNNMG
jgi:lysylphosphatidylglycerol synthetase-like protein (DUF2156 family)